MILITRPKDQAIELVQELNKLNFKTHKDLLISFRYRKPKINFDKNILYLVTSSNAVKSLGLLDKKKISLVKKMSFLVIGKKVSLSLKKLGIKKIKLTCMNGDTLVRKLETDERFANCKINYLCSNYYNKDLELKIRKLNIRIILTQVYSTLSKKKLSNKTIKLFQDDKIKIVTFYSSHTAQVFFNLLINTKIRRDKVQNVQFICLSKMIENVVIKQKYYNVSSAKIPTNASFLSIVKKQYKKQYLNE